MFNIYDLAYLNLRRASIAVFKTIITMIKFNDRMNDKGPINAQSIESVSIQQRVGSPIVSSTSEIRM